MSYCFICLFRADKGTSGLALRIPLLWKELAESGENVILVINKSLYNKTLKDLPNSLTHKVYIVPEYIDFKIDSLVYMPSLIAYLLIIKKIRRYHLSVGAAYFIDYLRKLAQTLRINIDIHTSIGSKNLDMIVDGNRNSKYYNLHLNLMNKADKIDCLYSPEGFPDFKYKCIQSPGSFSWKYNTTFIENLELPCKKSRDIVFCGTLIPQKNYRLAIDAYKIISDTFSESNYFSLILVAPSVPEELYNEIILFNQKSFGEIKFGKYEDIDNIFKESYIFLSLQDYDNYPSQSLIESMIYGCTIIATNIGETHRMVKEANGNILISKDIEQLVGAIKMLMSEPPVTNLNNLHFIKNNHTIKSYSKYFKDNFIKE